jgi:hypothetical protein
LTEPREMSCNSWEFKEKRIVLCEGKHDKYFLESLFKERLLAGFQVRHAAECNKDEIGGVEGFAPALESLVAMTGFRDLKGIAIVTDNDDKNALRRIKGKFRKNFKKDESYAYTTAQSDYIVSLRGKPVLIVLIPDNDNYGNLETLCLPVLYHQWSTAEKCVQCFLECTGATEWTNKNQIAKAKVRSIISGHYKKEPCIGLGELFQKTNMLSARHKCFDQLANTLSRFDEIIETGNF